MLFITIIIVIHDVVSKVPLTKKRKWEVQKRCCFDKNCSKWLFKLITTIEGRAGLGESLIVSVWAEIFHCEDFMYWDIAGFGTRKPLSLSFMLLAVATNLKVTVSNESLSIFQIQFHHQNFHKNSVNWTKPSQMSFLSKLQPWFFIVGCRLLNTWVLRS